MAIPELQRQVNILQQEMEMIEKLNHIDRCLRVCKKTKKECSLNTDHIECITDIVINKSWVVLVTIGKTKQECACKHMMSLLDQSTKSLEELIEWAQKIRKQQK